MPMFLLEIACAVLSTGAIISLLIPGASRAAKWLAAGSMLAAAAQAVIEGSHWQIYPEYLAALLVIVIAFVPRWPSHWHRIAFGWVLALDACAFILCFLLPVFSL